MATKTWDGSFSANWADGANWPGDTIPADGDDVVFDGGAVVTHKCTVGPTVQVALNSIIAKNGYDDSCCFDNCVVNTATIESDAGASTYIAGGLVAMAELVASWAKAGGGTFGTIKAVGSSSRVKSDNGAIVATNVICSGAGSNVSKTTSALTVTTVDLAGAGSYSQGGTITAVDMNNDTAEIRDAVGMALDTVRVYGKTCKIAASIIADGKISNGPYMLGRDQVLKDYTSGLVMVDTTMADGFGPGEF